MTDQTLEDRLRAYGAVLDEALKRPTTVDSSRSDRPQFWLSTAAVLLIMLGALFALFGRSDPSTNVSSEPSAPQTLVDEDNGSSDLGTERELQTTVSVEPEPEVEQPQDPEPPTDTTSPASQDAATQEGGATAVDGSPRSPVPGTESPPADAELSLAYGIWQPGPFDTCSQAVHDRYWVYGPDGKAYPTYHPPVDPVSGCTFGHEHGRDPADSDLADIPFPFGYVSELAVAAGEDIGGEDHTGHKIEWFNDGGYYESGSPNGSHDQICDVAYKVHMDTHSDDAFANNLHEVFHYARCENGSELVYRALHAFGNGGEFHMHCNQGAGPTVTVNGGGEPSDGPGAREIPASPCFEDRLLVQEGDRSDWFPFDERWTLYQSVDSEDFGRFFIQFFFFADLPSRYWDGEKLARTVDLCYLQGDLQVRDDEFCGPMRAANPGRQVTWDDPASPFNGADRQVFMIDLSLDNQAQQNDWYTDIHGGIWSAEPFPGAVRQYVGLTPIRAAASYEPSPIRSITFEDGLGIHAPN